MRRFRLVLAVLFVATISTACSYTPYKADEAFVLHENSTAEMGELGYIRPDARKGFTYDFGTVYFDCRITQVDGKSIPDNAEQIEVEPGKHKVVGHCEQTKDGKPYSLRGISPVFSATLNVKAGFRWEIEFERRMAMSGPKPHMYFQSYKFSF